MTPKEKTESLVGKFKIHCYCYLGSGMLSNTHDESVQLSNAKQCALICVEEILEVVESDESAIIVELQFWQQVKTEIEKL